MIPLVGIFVFSLGIPALFLLNRDREAHTAKALWLPVLWLSMAGSRMASQWLGFRTGADWPPDVLLEGSPVDRNVVTVLIALGLIVLFARGLRVATLLRVNVPILLFLFYCATSILWSDFPDIAFKRWIKALGDIVMVLIVLTDSAGTAAIKRLFARVGFILIPVSILMIYFLHMGLGYYGPWGTKPLLTGVTLNKNMLGLDCLILGLGSFWCFLQINQDGEQRRRTGPRIAHAIVLAMAVWLLVMGDSMTPLVCLMLASGLIMLMRRPMFSRRPALIHFVVCGVLSVCASAVLLNVGLVEKLGRDPTLTGRTEIWHEVVAMTSNPLVGTGFESFWLGDRYREMGNRHWWRPNEAHNGYLEVYINLGWVGVALLGLLMVTGYGNVLGMLRHDPETGSLKLAYLVVAAIYSLTEAGFRMMDLMWIFFLFATIAVPKMPEKETLETI
jgi:heme/copper-type cytochrome/quinol oxidase subunit 4